MNEFGDEMEYNFSVCFDRTGTTLQRSENKEMDTWVKTVMF